MQSQLRIPPRFLCAKPLYYHFHVSKPHHAAPAQDTLTPMQHAKYCPPFPSAPLLPRLAGERRILYNPLISLLLCLPLCPLYSSSTCEWAKLDTPHKSAAKATTSVSFLDGLALPLCKQKGNLGWNSVSSKFVNFILKACTFRQMSNTIFVTILYFTHLQGFGCLN